MNQLFHDRAAAGRLLAKRLEKFANRPDVIVLGLARGGVPVAFEVAKLLNAPLDVFLVRKLGVPENPELAMGAIASGGVLVVNEPVVCGLGIPPDVIEEVARKQKTLLRQRESSYRGHRAQLEIAGKTAILVDDGIATGSTMRAAVRAIRRQHCARVIIAVPTASFSSFEELRTEVDEFIALMVPRDFVSVGEWYEKFDQTSDEEVTSLLDRAHAESATTALASPQKLRVSARS